MIRSRVFLCLASALAAICFACASCVLPPANTIDLRPGVMTFSGDYVADGTSLSVALPVENLGSAATAAFTVHFYLTASSIFSTAADTDLGTASVTSGVSGDSSVTVNASLPIPELNVNEVRYIYAVVDSTGVVAESNETNNQSTTDAAAAVLVYDDENASRAYAIVLQTYLGSSPAVITGHTDTVMALYLENTGTATYLAPADIGGASDFSIIDKSSSPLPPGTYYVVVQSWTGRNGPYALSVRTNNISSSDLPRFIDLSSNAQDTWEVDDSPTPSNIRKDTTIPTKPDPVKVGSPSNRYSDANDWDWFTFVLP